MKAYRGYFLVAQQSSNNNRQGGYGQDYFGLRSTYIQGRPPKSVNFYFRRFPVSSIPVENPKAFEEWVSKIWWEKEALLEYYVQNGRFPPSEDLDPSVSGAPKGSGWIDTEVKLAHWAEVGQIFVVVATFALLASIAARFWNFALYGRFCFFC
jgi:hypothetical protein